MPIQRSMFVNSVFAVISELSALRNSKEFCADPLFDPALLEIVLRMSHLYFSSVSTTGRLPGCRACMSGVCDIFVLVIILFIKIYRKYFSFF